MKYDFFPEAYISKLNNDLSVLNDTYETIYEAKCLNFRKDHWLLRMIGHMQLGLLWACSMMIGVIIGVVLSLIANSSLFFQTLGIFMIAPPFVRMLAKKAYEHQYNREKIEARKCSDELKTEAKAERKKEYQDYLNGFNKATQDMTARFAGSPLITQMADELVIEMNEVINHADRSAHIERIHVERSFSVVPHGVRFVNWEGNGRIFSFEKARFINLTSPVQQAAVARVLANDLQLRYMENPTDPSGTVATVTTKESYTQDAAVFTLTYLAPNGNFRAVQKW